jgi:putative ABC transport system ATP-binding protein
MPDVSMAGVTVEFARGDYVLKPLDDFHAEAGDGELVMLLGPSGSGKTTLLSCLAAILRPTAGSIVVDGIETTRLVGAAVTRYRRQTVGIVFQAFNLLPALTALENVMVPLRVAGVGRRAARERATELLHMVGLRDRMSHVPGRLSGGQQQRVAIARALVHDPPVVIADEPTAHLDYVQLEGVARLVRSLAAPGRVVIVSTHDERLVPLADRVIRLGSDQPLPVQPPTGVRLAPGEVLFSEGELSDFIWVLESGTIELYRRGTDGTEHPIRQIHAGGYFGEMGPMLGIPRTASARALTPVVLNAYETRTFKQLVGELAPPGAPEP